MEEHFITPAGVCTKNPGHVQFIPTHSFQPTNLPEIFRSLLLWSLIYHKARLTVMLLVNHVSPWRPVEFQMENSVRNTGSGHVVGIDRSNPSGVTVIIETAAHLVFNDDEASRTTAKFYFSSSIQMFQLRHARLLDVNPGKDVSRIMFTVDLESMTYLVNDIARLEYALSPTVLPDINNSLNISLLQSVVARYNISQFTRHSFLFNEIKCVKNIRFDSINVTRKLQLEINVSYILLYDVILLIMTVASRCGHLMKFMENIGGRDVINIENPQRPFITVRKEIENGPDNIVNSTKKLPLNLFIEMDNQETNMLNEHFTIQGNVQLCRLMTCLIRLIDRIRTVNEIVELTELSEALTYFCEFDISARINRSGRIVLDIPVTSVSVLERMSLEVNLNDVRVEEEHDYIAVLVAHPHDMIQQVTIGNLVDSRPRRITYKTPSCPGSSGGPVLVIPREATSLNDLENIDVFTHSAVYETSGSGVGGRF